MREREGHLVGRAVAALALFALGCGTGGTGEAPDASLSTPKGTPSAWTCPPTSPDGPQPVMLPDGGSYTGCRTDADCGSGPGREGRCISFGDAGYECSYDECLADPDCGDSGVCRCGELRSGTPSGNTCILSDCRIDTDCGPGGVCAPTVEVGCGPFYGVVGYYCLTPKDECHTSSDCGNDGGAPAPYCAYDPSVGHWVCGSG